MVNKCNCDQRVTFLEGDVLREPLGWVNVCEPFANRVAAEFIEQGHSGGRVALLISLDRDTMNDDFGKAVLRNDTCSRSKQ